MMRTSRVIFTLFATCLFIVKAEQQKVDGDNEEPMMPDGFAKMPPINSVNENEINDTVQGDDPRVYYVSHPWSYGYYRAPLHTVVTSEEAEKANEAALRYYRYYHHYPRSALYAGYPYGYGLSESQWAWINSQHPEVRDKYLKDLGLNGYLTHPYYVRQPLAVVAEGPVSALDYSCHRTERDGRVISIKAPKLPNAYVHRYDRRQNSNYPYNDYLAAEYKCNPGYTMLDSKTTELYCSRSSWVGNPPVCV